MFAIRQKQYSAMGDISREEFTQRMERHLKEHFPLVFENHSEIQLREFITLNWQLATGYGLTSELAVCCYLEAASSLGEDFHDTSPWAKALLEKECSEADKLERLNQHALADSHPTCPA